MGNRIVAISTIVVLLLGAVTVMASNQPPALRSNDPPAVATVVAVQGVVKTGITPTFVAASASTNSFANDGHTVLYVKNAYSDVITATFTAAGTADGLTIANRTIAVANGAESVMGPFLPSVFNSAGSAVVSWSTVTSVTFAVLSW